jgi:6-phosphogluconolactonase
MQSDRPDDGDEQQQQEANEPAAIAPAAAAAAASAPYYSALIVVAASKDELASHLSRTILRCAADAVRERGAFSVALSGGSLPSLLEGLGRSNDDTGVGIDPHFDKWHVVLADERMVPLEHPDSNLGELSRAALSKLPIPPSQIYGPRLPGGKESSDAPEDEDDQAIASEYDATIRHDALRPTHGALDVAVLGFGPDGHTCSLFPHHPLLTRSDPNVWVAAISDSPKPPPRRITLTLSMLNTSTRNVIFCGAGSSKSPILQQVFRSVHSEAAAAAASSGDDNSTIAASQQYTGVLADPPPYPCAMVRPKAQHNAQTSVTWIIDADAAVGVIPPSTTSASSS